MSINTITTAARLVKELSGKELKEQFAQFSLGVWWLVLFPLLFILGLSVVGSIALGRHTMDDRFLLVLGFMLWFFFANACTESLQYVLREKRVCFSFAPVEVHYLPPIKVITNYAILLVEFLVVAGFIGWKLGSFWFVPRFLIGSFFFFLFTVGVSYALNVLTLYVRDTRYLIPYALMFVFWLTPIMFSPERVPAAYALVFKMNPLYYFFAALQYGAVDQASWGIETYGVLALLGVGTCAVGGALCYILRKRLIKLLAE